MNILVRSKRGTVFEEDVKIFLRDFFVSGDAYVSGSKLSQNDSSNLYSLFEDIQKKEGSMYAYKMYLYFLSMHGESLPQSVEYLLRGIVHRASNNVSYAWGGVYG